MTKSGTKKNQKTMTSKCGRCHQEFTIQDNEFFCDDCKPFHKETLESLDEDSDECLSCQ